MGAAVAVAVSCTSTLSGLTPLPTTATAATSTAAVTTATVATPAAVPLVRRFGGPFFPIANFDSMPSDIRCQKLQQSLCQILDSWRSARQYLKDLDQRVTRSQRMRAKRHTELGHHERAVARSPSPLMPSAPPSVSSPPLLSQ
nr:unnamed protein product [Spirometra erinaceieuropaei]